MFNLDDHLWRDVISAEEELLLDRVIPDLTRKYSRKILRYGVSKYRNNLVSVEVPQYLLDLAHQLTRLGILKFRPKDYTINIYKPGDSIGYHIDLGDDDTLILNLLCPITFNLEKNKKIISFEFPNRSVLLLTGEYRTEWKHAIEPVKERRISIVFR
ncbi:AlkB Alkylated DNA repair protein [uncultured Caudovirales phage]|uniref:AlkB Alkylated DNA repair protein n=1 Tax=uncultured Caudovirales phage TaxID=2100421 RepID=A0A6J5Q1J5_9CAUD|nr:AlkB Alkylated DNA repair protein [uncultured Caudovirales phage]